MRGPDEWIEVLAKREARIAELERELEIERTRPITQSKLARVKALVTKWREHAADYPVSRGYWSEYVTDCADELEVALADLCTPARQSPEVKPWSK